MRFLPQRMLKMRFVNLTPIAVFIFNSIEHKNLTDRNSSCSRVKPMKKQLVNTLIEESFYIISSHQSS